MSLISFKVNLNKREEKELVKEKKEIKAEKLLRERDEKETKKEGSQLIQEVEWTTFIATLKHIKSTIKDTNEKTKQFTATLLTLIHSIKGDTNEISICIEMRFRCEKQPFYVITSLSDIPFELFCVDQFELLP